MAMKKPDFSWPPHPSLARSYGILEPYFAQHIVPEEGQVRNGGVAVGVTAVGW